jgi:hypothetical protein
MLVRERLVERITEKFGEVVDRSNLTALRAVIFSLRVHLALPPVP